MSEQSSESMNSEIPAIFRNRIEQGSGLAVNTGLNRFSDATANFSNGSGTDQKIGQANILFSNEDQNQNKNSEKIIMSG